MKTAFPTQKPNETGSALALTLIMTGIALAILAGAMTWSANTTRQTHRSIQYARTVAAAEAATEKVMSRLSRDFMSGGDKLVGDNLANNLTGYRQMVPTSADSSYWDQWEFNDAAGHIGKTFVRQQSASQYKVLASTYEGLRGFASTFTVVAHAREKAALQNVVAGVLQDVQLARIPIFQFAMYSSGDMEISCGQPLTIGGRVHSNKTLYVLPDKELVFQSDVTAVGQILFQPHPLDTRPEPCKGSVVYQVDPQPGQTALVLPIGTNNSPEAIREIIQPPPFGENASSPLGRMRYYNLADMILVVDSTGIGATSGKFNSFTTIISSNQLAGFVVTTNSFYDAREEKTVRPIDINVGLLNEWSKTNDTLRVAIDWLDVKSVYVLDRRTLPGNELGAVRLFNGRQLPLDGLTVATARPLYVQGHYNQASTNNLATTNTITTRPASLVADAVTILSTDWSDANSTLGVGARKAAPTTVNAAILTGVVETTTQPAPLTGYSGGMENFPRFLEKWGLANTLTYNGSMVRMFPSLYATNAWGKKEVYDPPKRDWAYDINFNDATKLPPLTPSLITMIRGRWATVAANQNAVAAP